MAGNNIYSKYDSLYVSICIVDRNEKRYLSEYRKKSMDISIQWSIRVSRRWE